MNINATLFGQMITFTIFVIFTMKFVWPHITKALSDRQKKIADGLAAAERGERSLELAQHKVADMLRDAKIKSSAMIDQANYRANHIIEDAKNLARNEGERMLALATEEIKQEMQNAKEQLRKQLAGLTIIGAEKLLGHHLDQASNQALLDKLINDIKP